MIKSFKSAETERLFNRAAPRRLPSTILRTAYRKLRQLHVSEDLEELRSPPGNHLELLRGDREGQHSIRINDQWRVCFVWQDGDAYQVEIVDYH